MEKLTTKKRFSDWFSDTRTPYRCEWIFYVSVCALLVFTNSYADIITTAPQGLKLWSCLFSGNIQNFYNITKAAYPFTIYIIFAVINLPMYLISAIFGVEMLDQWWFIGYNKLWLVAALLLSVRLLETLGREIGLSERESKWAGFIYLTSAYAMYSLVIVGQYDIFAIIFMLLALISLQKRDTKRFLLWFSIAITMKYFALIAFIPILLLTEKKILQILKKTVVVCVPTLLFMRAGFIFRWFISDELKQDGSLEGSLINTWFPNPSIAVGKFGVSFFIVAYIILLVYCYTRDFEGNKRELVKHGIYVSACAYALFFLFINFYPYWIILLTPFFSLMMFFNKRRFKINLLLDIFASGSMVLMFDNVLNCWCTGYESVARSLVGVLFDIPTRYKPVYVEHWLMGFLERLGCINLWAFVQISLFSVFFAGTLMLLYVNRPRNGTFDMKPDLKIERSVIWSRAACSIILGLLPVINIVGKELYYRGAL